MPRGRPDASTADRPVDDRSVRPGRARDGGPVTEYREYRHHYCDAAHRSYRTVAKCLFGNDVTGDAPWAALTAKGTVLCPTLDIARATSERVILIANPCVTQTEWDMSRTYARAQAPEPVGPQGGGLWNAIRRIFR